MGVLAGVLAGKGAGMIRRLALAIASMTLSVGTAALAQTPPPAPLQPEVSDVATLPPATPPASGYPTASAAAP